MKTASIQDIADQYQITYGHARTIMGGMQPIEKVGIRCFYDHADACRRVDAYLSRMIEPDTTLFTYQKIMNKQFKAANETVCIWIKHAQFPKPVGQFVGKNYKVAPYWRIDDVQAFLNEYRISPGYHGKVNNAPKQTLDEDYLDSKQANIYLQLPTNYLIKAWKQIPDLPKPTLQKRQLFWRKSELQAWVESLGDDNTPHDVFLDYYRVERNLEFISPFDKAARLFITGHYATPEQKQAQQRRREHARSIKPKTKIVQVPSQW